MIVFKDIIRYLHMFCFSFLSYRICFKTNAIEKKKQIVARRKLLQTPAKTVYFVYIYSTFFVCHLNEHKMSVNISVEGDNY